MVKRFDFNNDGDFVVRLDGVYVEYNDYEKLEKKNQDLQNDIFKLEKHMGEVMKDCVTIGVYVKLQEENRTLKHHIETDKIHYGVQMMNMQKEIEWLKNELKWTVDRYKLMMG